MCKKIIKKCSIYAFMLMIVMGIVICCTNVEAKGETKLNKTKITVQVGKKNTIKLKNNAKTVKWSTTNKKIVKIVKKSKKQVQIKGVKAGTAYIKAKVGKKTYKCKVVVKKKSSDNSEVIIPTTDFPAV